MDSSQKLEPQPYRHDPLGKDQIRLLRIKSGPKDSVVHCEMSTFPRYHWRRPSYEALSYTWGPSTTLSQILINGKSFTIRKNLFDFLATARGGKTKPTRASRSRGISLNVSESLRSRYRPSWLWIDQICIDQSSNAEKSDQVWRMNETYEGAHRVVVWLGIGTDHSAIILANIAQLSRLPCICELIAARKKYPDWEARYFTPDAPLKYDDWKHFINHNIDNFVVMGDFFKLEYWSRVWIVQEILLSRDLIFMWGNSYAQLSDISAPCLEFFFRNEHIKLLQLGSITSGDLECSWDNLDEKTVFRVTDLLHDREKVLRIRKLNLVDLLSKHLHKSCEKPVDRVYALLNVSEYAGIIDVDYTKPVVHLYLELVGKLALNETLQRTEKAELVFQIGVAMGITGDEVEWQLKETLTDILDPNRQASQAARRFGRDMFYQFGLAKEELRDGGAGRQHRLERERDASMERKASFQAWTQSHKRMGPTLYI